MMSGYIATEAIPKYAAFIAKPFRVTDLCSVVASALAPPAAEREQAS